MEKWICNRCGAERQDKPKNNETCSCHGRFRRFRKCGCGKWFCASNGNKFCNDCIRINRDQPGVGLLTVTCAYCGNQFQRFAGNIKGKKLFCDINCKREYERSRWLERTCMQCGKQFMVRESAIRSTNATGHYCSRECYEKSLHKEGSKYWRDGFERVKREHFKGVQFCAICGTTKNIHIHHIIPFKMTHDNGLDNLIPLCGSHHTRVERIWLPFIQMFDNPADAKPYVANVLRSRQSATAAVLMDVMERVKAKRSGR